MFHIKENNTIKYITSDIFDDGNFIHAFSTRISGNDKNFVLMDKSNPQDIHIKENRQKFCSIFNIDPKSLVIPEQTHSSNIKIIKDNIPQLQNTDGIIITTPGITGMLFFADCTPVILYSKRHKTYALIHAGWKGTAASISAKAVRIMKSELNINPSEIKAAIGACISKCCFEINEDIKEKLNNSLNKDCSQTIFYEKNKKIFADLKAINKLQLEEEGIKDIDIMEYCSVCQNDLFFSYRKENSTAKRHAILAQMK